MQKPSVNKYRILVVEDEALIAAEIKSTLNLLGYLVVGHAMNGDKALDLFTSLDYDLVLLDINIKGTLDGIDLAKILRTKYNIPFIFITSFSDQLTLNKAKDQMPYGYIVKPFTENDIKVNIQLALHKYTSEQNAKIFNKEGIEKKLSLSFTDREFAILEAFDKGLTYKEAGEKLFVSVNTIKSYQKKLFQMLKVSSRHELIEKLRG